MDKDLQIMKAIIDESVKRGIFQDGVSVVNAMQAWQNLGVKISELEKIKAEKNGGLQKQPGSAALSGDKK
jgi:hypothetical protein